jgi:hypothetical protein
VVIAVRRFEVNGGRPWQNHAGRRYSRGVEAGK